MVEGGRARGRLVDDVKLKTNLGGRPVRRENGKGIDDSSFQNLHSTLQNECSDRKIHFNADRLAIICITLQYSLMRPFVFIFCQQMHPVLTNPLLLSLV